MVVSLQDGLIRRISQGKRKICGRWETCLSVGDVTFSLLLILRAAFVPVSGRRGGVLCLTVGDTFVQPVTEQKVQYLQ